MGKIRGRVKKKGGDAALRISAPKESTKAESDGIQRNPIPMKLRLKISHEDTA